MFPSPFAHGIRRGRKAPSTTCHHFRLWFRADIGFLVISAFDAMQPSVACRVKGREPEKSRSLEDGRQPLRRWPDLLVLELGEALLRRNGEIVAAVGEVHRRVLSRDPEFGEQMIGAGRMHEISIALREDTGCTRTEE